VRRLPSIQYSTSSASWGAGTSQRSIIESITASGTTFSRLGFNGSSGANITETFAAGFTLTAGNTIQGSGQIGVTVSNTGGVIEASAGALTV